MIEKENEKPQLQMISGILLIVRKTCRKTMNSSPYEKQTENRGLIISDLNTQGSKSPFLKSSTCPHVLSSPQFKHRYIIDKSILISADLCILIWINVPSQ